jgi:hypothetical protein
MTATSTTNGAHEPLQPPRARPAVDDEEERAEH